MLFSLSGGILYHLRAHKYGQTLWKPFHSQIRDWLSLQLGTSTRGALTIVGPSGGYALSTSLLIKFQTIDAYDPDLAAKWVFGRNLKLPNLIWHRKKVRPQGLKTFSSGDTVLFSNLLGQLHLEVGERQLAEWKEAIQLLSRRTRVLSFHDRFSGPIQPKLQSFASPARLSDDEVLARFYTSQQSGELIDHCVSGFFDPALPHHYFVWQLKPGSFHLIEAVSSKVQ